jgi:hypothetical protein
VQQCAASPVNSLTSKFFPIYSYFRTGCPFVRPSCAISVESVMAETRISIKRPVVSPWHQGADNQSESYRCLMKRRILSRFTI